MNRPPEGLGAPPPARPAARARRRRPGLRELALALVAAGALACLAPFAIVGYGIWEESQLTRSWAAQAAAPTAPPVVDASADLPAPDGAPTPTPAPRRAAIQALFAIRVPKIGYYAAVQEGVSLSILATGPGHYPASALPGRPGLVAIAAHNTYWIPFGQLGAGDSVVLETRTGKFTYRVTGTKIVNPDDASVLVPTADPRLVMTTCWPLWAGNLAPQRLAIFAQQV